MLFQKQLITALILLSPFCFNTAELFSQQNPSSLSANLNPYKNQRNILQDREQWVEIENQRTVYSSTYKTPDGRIINHSSQEPLNYYNSSKILVPIITVPKKNTTGLSAADQPFPVSVLNNGSVEINTGGEKNIVYSSNCKINGIATSVSEIKQNGAIATMENIFPGINKIGRAHV